MSPSPRAPTRLHRRAVHGLTALLALIGNSGARICASHAALTSRPAFFASPRACAASKLFSKQECDDGFGDALAEIRARGLTFMSQFECVARFRLCERVGLGAEADSKHAFRPTLLGIEIARGPGGRLSKPVFAVETSPELFPPKPIVSAVPPAPEARGGQESVQKVRRPSAELPVDHFEVVDSWEIKKRWASFQLKAEDPPTAPAVAESRQHETAQQRRERLQNAPYIE
jgi:hypothetical protein